MTHLGNQPTDLPELPIKLDTLHRIIKPAIDDAKELDKLMHKNKKAGYNNKFIMEVAEAFDIADDVIDQNLSDKNTLTEKRRAKELESILKEFRERKFYL